MHVKIMDITPAIASRYLENNVGNRKTNKNTIDMLVRTIKAGGWKLTHQGIAFYEDHSIADGQHRLMAVAESGVTCTMTVTVGLKKTKAVMMAVDCGRPRTVSEGIQMSGDKMTPATVSLVKGLEFGYDEHMKKLTHYETSKLCDKHKVQVDIADDILKEKCKGVSIMPVKVAILNAISNGVNQEIAHEFYSALVTGVYTSDIMSNAIRLRNKLVLKTGRSNCVMAYNMTFNTIMSTSRGKYVKRVSHSRILETPKESGSVQ